MEGYKAPPELSPYSGWVLEQVLSRSPKEIPSFVRSSPAESDPLTCQLSSCANPASPADQLGSTPLSTEAPSDTQVGACQVEGHLLSSCS